MRRRLRIAFGLAAAVTGLTVANAPASATIGGPALAEVLGMDSGAQQIVVAIHHVDETGRLPTFWMFDLRSATPARPQRLEWSVADEGDTLVERREAALRVRLRPLKEHVPLGSITLTDAAVPYDSTSTGDGVYRRYSIPLYFMEEPQGLHNPFRVISLDPAPHAIRILREYAIGGHDATLVILSWAGVPNEGGYEIQLPVLIGESRGRLDPLDPQLFDRDR